MKCLQEMDTPALAIAALPLPLPAPVGIPVRKVAGVGIYVRAIARSRSPWAKVILSLRPDECFHVPTETLRKSVLRAGKTLGVQLTSRKENGFWIWLKNQTP